MSNGFSCINSIPFLNCNFAPTSNRLSMISLVMAAVFVATVYAQAVQNQTQMMEDIKRACTVYCEGDVLRTVQMSGIYNDSKTFVDMPMRFDPEEVVAAFNAIPDPTNVTALQEFLDNNFFEVGSDLYSSPPADLQVNPPFLNAIADPAYRAWASEINQLWGLLGKQVNASVAENPQRHSFVPLNHPMIVPGGRFRESYYWDSWWILKGLLVCDMAESAMNVVNILLDEVSNFGFVPNGARIYYLDRSQPPVLSEMVLDLCAHLGWDSANTSVLLQRAYPLLETEYAWWMDPANGHVAPPLASLGDPESPLRFTLNQYHSNGTTPRPESYLEDVTNGNTSGFWNNVRTGAETGWDFSSRWIAAPHLSVQGIATSEIVPVDLNAILYRYELNLALLQEAMSRQPLALVNTTDPEAGLVVPIQSTQYYTEAAQNRSVAVEQLLWSNSSSCWLDFNLTAGGPNADGIASASSYVPLWAGLIPQGGRGQAHQLGSVSSTVVPGRGTHVRATAVLASFVASGLHQPGGVLTTTDASGQQWDAPNAWPPLVWLTIEGLLRLGIPAATDLAVSHRFGSVVLCCVVVFWVGSSNLFYLFVCVSLPPQQNISVQWLWTGFLAFNASGYMYEKYDAFEPGVGGGGGEYVPQVGFGWTNGVALYLLNNSLPAVVLDDDSVGTDDDSEQFDLAAVFGVTAALFLLLVCSFGSYIWYYRIADSASSTPVLLDARSKGRGEGKSDGSGEPEPDDEALTVESNPLVVTAVASARHGPTPNDGATEDIELVDKV